MKSTTSLSVRQPVGHRSVRLLAVVITLCRLGRTLDAIAPHLQGIWLEIVSRAFEHYDIALSVFVMTGEYRESELADFGFAHNTPMNRRKTKLAGNATRDGGLPLSWGAIYGRVADTATVEENLRRQDWPEEGVLVVGDRATLKLTYRLLKCEKQA